MVSTFWNGFHLNPLGATKCEISKAKEVNLAILGLIRIVILALYEGIFHHYAMVKYL